MKTTQPPVPFSFLAILLASLTLYSCNFPGNLKTKTGSKDSLNTNITQKSKPKDSIIEKLSGGMTLKVIPATSIGRLQLKMEVDGSPVFKLLGRADSGDAAMCKSWSMWYWKDAAGTKKEFDMYAVCDPDVDMKKTIQILRVEGTDFLTRRGSSKSGGLKELKVQYPDLSRLGEFSNPEGETITLWDDIKAGIAFELPYPGTGKNISAVMVHQPGKKITETYLPFYSAVRKE